MQTCTGNTTTALAYVLHNYFVMIANYVVKEPIVVITNTMNSIMIGEQHKHFRPHSAADHTHTHTHTKKAQSKRYQTYNRSENSHSHTSEEGGILLGLHGPGHLLLHLLLKLLQVIQVLLVLLHLLPVLH